MIQIKEIGPIDSLKLFRQVKRNNLSVLVDLGNKNTLTSLMLGGKKTLIPATTELLHQFFNRDQKTMVKTPRAQDYTAKAMGLGLVSTDQEAWVEKRKQVRGIFNPQQINSLMDVVQDSINHQLSQVSDSSHLSELFCSISINVIGHTFFGVFSNSDGEKIRELVNCLLESIFKRFVSPIPFFVDPFNRHTSKARRTMFEILDKNIEKARLCENDNLIKHYYPIGNCTEDISNLFAAGYETTSNTLTWLFYEIGRHTDVNERLSKELNNVSGFESYQDLLQQIPYTIACVREVLRLYPPGWIMSRTTIERFSIEDIEVPVNTDIILSPYLFHRLDKYWTAPNQFDPTRFLGTEIPLSEALFYFPFGIGPRSCIGDKLALMEIYLVLLAFFQNYNFTIDSKKVVPKAHFTLRPSEIILINLNKKIF